MPQQENKKTLSLSANEKWYPKGGDKKEEWEDEFDRMNEKGVFMTPHGHPNPHTLKSFISTLISRTKEQAYKEIKEKKEALAELEHEQWMEWARYIAGAEPISPERLERWNKLFVPYSQLTEEQKDQDRKWADKIINLLT